MTLETNTITRCEACWDHTYLGDLFVCPDCGRLICFDCGTEVNDEELNMVRVCLACETDGELENKWDLRDDPPIEVEGTIEEIT